MAMADLDDAAVGDEIRPYKIHVSFSVSLFLSLKKSTPFRIGRGLV